MLKSYTKTPRFLISHPDLTSSPLNLTSALPTSDNSQSQQCLPHDYYPSHGSLPSVIHLSVFPEPIKSDGSPTPHQTSVRRAKSQDRKVMPIPPRHHQWETRRWFGGKRDQRVRLLDISRISTRRLIMGHRKSA